MTQIVLGQKFAGPKYWLLRAISARSNTPNDKSNCDQLFRAAHLMCFESNTKYKRAPREIDF
ncbi:hypothetical protein BpHYR1_014556 [Brachionus plicatilis]|uniref:Uncharacterized protein n=1 Tax=Brachionus plicatilis TaxID=10195 RepID=A0A3M7PTM2_BRAPC|nr:hypothetical protein BpHYR1_014556 [Brachionus plicatilis]